MWQKQVKVNYQDPFKRVSEEDKFPYLDGISPIKKIASSFVLDPTIYASTAESIEDENAKICTFAIKDIPSKPTIKAISEGQCRDHLQVIGAFRNGDVLVRTNKEAKTPHIRVPESHLLPPLKRVYVDQRSHKEKLLHPLHPALPKFAIDVAKGEYDAYEDNDIFPVPAKDLFYHPGTEWEFDKYDIGDIEIPTFKNYVTFLKENEEEITVEKRYKEEATQEELSEGIARLKNTSRFTIAHGVFGSVLQLFMMVTIVAGGFAVYTGLSKTYNVPMALIIMGAFAITAFCALFGISANRKDVDGAIAELERRLGKSLEETEEKGLDIPLTEEIISIAHTFESKQKNKETVHTPFWYNDKRYDKIRNLYNKEKSKLDAKYASVIVESD